MWAIKTPKGKLITSTAYSDKYLAIEDFIAGQIELGFIIDVKAFYGEEYFEKMWEPLNNHGYEAVECFVDMQKEGGWTFPVLIQLPHQLTLLMEVENV